MDLITAMEISASGLSAQRTRLNIISMNLANAQTTRTAEGGPYRRRMAVFTAQPFVSHLERSMDVPPYSPNGDSRRGVLVKEISLDDSPLPTVYDPTHPDADQDGYVRMPNVNTVNEMVNMITASRSYEANVTAVNASKNMALKALEIGR